MESQPQRIYHFHVRKTAGSSLNAAFWALGGFEGLDSRAMRRGVESNGLRFVTTTRELIEAGDYFYATSHHPAWWITVPRDTFTVTILRDPAARLISYYRYLSWVRGDSQSREAEPFANEVAAESAFIDGGARYALGQLSPRRLRFERSAIGALGPRQFLARLAPRRRQSAFRDFLARVPPRHLYTQLHMFSERFDPGEAAERALACSAVCFTETFPEDLQRLSATLQLELTERHERRFGDAVELTAAERELLRERLAPEYEMVERVRASLAPAGGQAGIPQAGPVPSR